MLDMAGETRPISLLGDTENLFLIVADFETGEAGDAQANPEK
jgi:hypothetical protein